MTIRSSFFTFFLLGGISAALYGAQVDFSGAVLKPRGKETIVQAKGKLAARILTVPADGLSMLTPEVRDNKIHFNTEAFFREADPKKKVVLYDDSYFIYKDGTDVRADRFVWQGSDKDITAQGNVVIRKSGELRTYSNEAVLSNQMTTVKIKGRSKTELYSKGNFDGKI